MVTNNIKLLDKIHLQKYIFLFDLFLSNQIDAISFESMFLQIRRQDNYWLSGSFDEQISKILDSFFLDIDSFNPDDLFDPCDKFNINSTALFEKAVETIELLKKLM